jgi:hypothetical protein
MNAYLEDSKYFGAYAKDAETTAEPIKLSETLDNFLQTLGLSPIQRSEPNKGANTPNGVAVDHTLIKAKEGEQNIKKSKHYKEISKEIPEENAEVLLRRLSKVPNGWLCITSHASCPLFFREPKWRRRG